MEGSIHRFNGSGDSKGTFGIVHLGADYLVFPDLLVGIQGQYDDMSQRSGRQNYKVEGKGWMAGPYATARLHKNLYLDGRLAWGLSHNEISPDKTYKDNFTSERGLAAIALSGHRSSGTMTVSDRADSKLMLWD